MRTPWGEGTLEEVLPNGLRFVSTPSHGGWHVPGRLNLAVHPAWRKADGWYEEDCEYAIVVLTFREWFPESMHESAHKAAAYWFPEAYAKVKP